MNLEEQVINILKMILETERDVEELKITLAENIRFDISDAFKTIDANMKGYIIPQDVFRFMSKNGFSVNLKMCDFWIYTTSKGKDKLAYQHFLEFIIPRYDKEAAMACITRKLYAEVGQYKLSFYLEEFVSKLIFKELEYTKQIEVEKMKLAQLVQWKFNVVFSAIAGPDAKSLDKAALDALLARHQIAPLTTKDYLMFLKRFNRNDDKLIQKDEFSDAIFPSGYLMQQREQQKDGFHDFVMNQNQQLDQYLGRDFQQEDEDFVFKPEEHKINTSQHEELVRDAGKRFYLNEDPQLAVSHFDPTVQRNADPQMQPRIEMSFKPAQFQAQTQSKLQNTSGQVKSKNYVATSQQSDLLQQFERKQMEIQQNSQVQFQNSLLFSQNQSNLKEYQNYLHSPSNAQMIMMQK